MTTAERRLCTDGHLTGIGHAYIAFLNNAGKAINQDFEQDVPKIFAPACKKIVNGKSMFDTSDALGSYLWKAQEIYGKWRIHQDYHLYPSTSTRSIVINFIAETEHAQLLVIAILKIDIDGLITEIFEVDNIR